MATAGMAQGKPPDGGYGWVILAACSVCMFLAISLGRIGGLIFSAIVEEFHVSRTQASVIFVTGRVLAFGSAPIAGKLLEHYTYKSIFGVSGILMGIGFICTSFCTEIWQMVLTYGIVLGTGSGLLIPATMLIIGMYFKKRKSFAFGIYFAVGGCGGFITPIIFGYLLEEYRFQGALLILGACLFHPSALGMLIRQPYWIKKSPSTTPQTDPLLKEENTQSEEQILNVDSEQVHMVSLLSLNKEGHREEAHHSNRNGVEHKPVSTKWRRIRQMASRLLSGLKEDLAIFKDVTFVALLINRVGLAFPMFTFLSYFPDYVKHEFSENMNDKDIANVLAMSAIGDIISRFFVGSVLEKLPWKKKWTICGLGLCVATFFLTFQLAQTYTALFIYIIVYGLLTGHYVVCHMVLEMELIGTKKLPVAHGFIQFFLGIATLVGGILLGYIRDVRGSYEVGIYLMGTSALCGALVWFLEPLLRKCFPKPVDEEEKLENNCIANGNRV